MRYSKNIVVDSEFFLLVISGASLLAKCNKEVFSLFSFYFSPQTTNCVTSYPLSCDLIGELAVHNVLSVYCYRCRCYFSYVEKNGVVLSH